MRIIIGLIFIPLFCFSQENNRFLNQSEVLFPVKQINKTKEVPSYSYQYVLWDFGYNNLYVASNNLRNDLSLSRYKYDKWFFHPSYNEYYVSPVYKKEQIVVKNFIYYEIINSKPSAKRIVDNSSKESIMENLYLLNKIEGIDLVIEDSFVNLLDKNLLIEAIIDKGLKDLSGNLLPEQIRGKNTFELVEEIHSTLLFEKAFSKDNLVLIPFINIIHRSQGKAKWSYLYYDFLLFSEQQGLVYRKSIAILPEEPVKLQAFNNSFNNIPSNYFLYWYQYLLKEYLDYLNHIYD